MIDKASIINSVLTKIGFSQEQKEKFAEMLVEWRIENIPEFLIKFQAAYIEKVKRNEKFYWENVFIAIASSLPRHNPQLPQPKQPKQPKQKRIPKTEVEKKILEIYEKQKGIIETNVAISFFYNGSFKVKNKIIRIPCLNGILTNGKVNIFRIIVENRDGEIEIVENTKIEKTMQDIIDELRGII